MIPDGSWVHPPKGRIILIQIQKSNLACGYLIIFPFDTIWEVVLRIWYAVYIPKTLPEWSPPSGISKLWLTPTYSKSETHIVANHFRFLSIQISGSLGEVSRE